MHVCEKTSSETICCQSTVCDKFISHFLDSDTNIWPLYVTITLVTVVDLWLGTVHLK